MRSIFGNYLVRNFLANFLSSWILFGFIIHSFEWFVCFLVPGIIEIISYLAKLKPVYSVLDVIFSITESKITELQYVYKTKSEFCSCSLFERSIARKIIQIPIWTFQYNRKKMSSLMFLYHIFVYLLRNK